MIIRFLLAFVIFAQSASAFPWKKIAKAALIWGAPVGTSLLATKGGMDCRARFGPEPCTVRYGEFGQMEAWRGGISFTMSATTYGCLKETGWKGCYGFALGQSAFNLYWWRHEENIRAVGR